MLCENENAMMCQIGIHNPITFEAAKLRKKCVSPGCRIIDYFCRSLQ